MSGTEYSRAVGEALRKQRVALDLTLISVAAALKFSPSALSEWERGIATISSYTHRRLEAYYKAERKAREGGSR